MAGAGGEAEALELLSQGSPVLTFSARAGAGRLSCEEQLRSSSVSGLAQWGGLTAQLGLVPLWM